jgi:hypothetical protein
VPILSAMADPPTSPQVRRTPVDVELPLTRGGYAVYRGGDVAGSGDPLEVRVTGPDGREVPVVRVDDPDPDGQTTQDDAGRTFLMTARFSAPSDGSYRVQLTTSSPDSVLVEEYRGLFGRAFLLWLLKVSLSGTLLLLALVLLVIGLVRWLSSAPARHPAPPGRLSG